MSDRKAEVVDLALDSNNVSPEQKKAMLAAALTLVQKSMGFHLLPIEPQGKILPRPSRYTTKKPRVAYGSACQTVKTTQKWWGAGGPFEGFNMGASLGGTSGMMVLDLDVDKEGKVDGIDTLKQWAKEEGQTLDFETTAVATPSGGLHYYFAHDSRLQNRPGTSLKLAIDIKSGHPHKDNSHCNLPPSTFGGKAYTFTVPPEKYGVGKMPEWLVSRLIAHGWGTAPVGSGKPRGTGLGNENIAAEDLEQIPDKQQVIEMLACIDPNEMEYDDWFRVLPTLHHIFSLLNDLDEGLEIADEWSQWGKRYKVGEVHARWGKLNDPGYVPGPRGLCTSPTLFRLAKEGGWKPKEGDKSGSAVGAAIEEINRLYPAAKLGNKVRMINVTDDGSLHPFTPADVRFIYENKKVPVGEDGKLVNPIDLWKAADSRIMYEGVGLYPPPDPAPHSHLNLWSGWSVEPQEGDVTPFTDYVHEVICGGNEKYSTWLLDWGADIFQEPGKKKGAAVAFRGKEGCGKGTFTLTLADLLMPAQFSHFIDTDQFMSEFNGHVLSAVLILADEAVWSGNRKFMGKLKGLITESSIMVQFKGVDTFAGRSNCRVVIHTNEDWSIPAGPESRRYFALNVSNHRIGDREYWNDLHGWIAQNKPALLHYFLNREITSDLRQALVTEELKEQRRLTADRHLGLVDRTILSLLHEGRAVKATDGPHVGNWVWPNGEMRAEAYLINENKQVGSSFPTSVNRALEKMGLEVTTGRSKKLNRYTVLPESPPELAALLGSQLSMTAEEMDCAESWTTTVDGGQSDG